MKIVSLLSENIKRLSVVEIKPDGNLVQICGKNGSGKTSVLDSLLWALDGSKAIQSKPIRRGQTQARIRLDLGDIIVTRKFTEGGNTTLTVESAEGARYPSPQAMLDKLLGSISFDPLAFTRQKPREQFDTLRDLVKVDVDFDQIDALNRGDFGRRAEFNKDAKTLRAQIEGYRPFSADLPAEPIDISALVDEIGKVGEHNVAIDRKREARERMAEKAQGMRDEAKLKTEQAAKLRADADKLDQFAANFIAEADKIAEQLGGYEPLSAPVDPAEVKHRLEVAQGINDELKRKARRDELVRAADEKEAAAKALTEKMDAREKAKKDAIAAAKMPVDGIGFGDGQVMLNGVPFEQGSDAEQLRASCAIAMAMNPKLRVLRIRDGSLLDENGLKLLAEMAEANDYQVWIERVDSSGKVGVVLEDGHVKATEHIEANGELVGAR